MVKVVDGLIMSLGDNEHLVIPKNAKGIADICYEKFMFHSHIKSIAVEQGNQCFFAQGNCLFKKCDNITTLVLGCENSVIPDIANLAIGYLAFGGIKIKNIDLPQNIISIDASAFAETDLEEINLPERLQSIGNFAFLGTNLKSVSIPAGVKEIGMGAFSFNPQLNSITVSDFNEHYLAENDCLVEKSANMLVACVANAVVPNWVKAIAPATFYGLAKNTAITLPSSVQQIQVFPNKILPVEFEFPITIKAPKDSYAHTFAIENDIKYIAI